MGRSKRVLIVDDRKIVRQTLRNILEDCDCTFSEAEDGASALAAVSDSEFDVIFLDLKLPDLSGIEVLRKARELGKMLGKVIILTGLPEVATQEEASLLGVFRYLTKDPLDWTEIRATFSEAMSDARPAVSVGERQTEFTRVIRAPKLARIRTSRKRTPLRPSQPRLLVLDDNHRWLNTLRQLLAKDFDLELTTSPDEACKRVRKQNFALVVLDMRLVGGISGLDVLSRMRRSVPGLRAIILTGHPEFNSAVESGRRGALAYVSKGELAMLAETIGRILAQDRKPIQVFLSYARADIEKVSRLFHKLMGRGFLPWMDVKSIVAGKKWEPEIQKAIHQSDYFVFCLSERSLYREGTLRKEIKWALDRQDGLLDSSIFFITARIEDCEVTPPFDKFQYVDLFKKDGFANLLEAFASGRRADK